MLRKSVSILLILLMSFQSVYKLGLVTYFEVNRDFIAKTLCINKAKPEKHCNGQCYLKRKLKKAEEKEKTPASSTREKTDFQYFVIENFEMSILGSTTDVIRNTLFFELSPQNSSFGQFRPPSYS